MDLSSFRLLRASCCSFVMLGFGWLSLLKDGVDSSPHCICSFLVQLSDCLFNLDDDLGGWDVCRGDGKIQTFLQ